MQHSLRRYGSFLLRYLRPQRKRVALLSVLLIGSIILRIANPQIIRVFIDSATSSDPNASRSLVIAAALFLFLAVFTQALAVSATYFGENVGWYATNQLRADLLLYTLRLDMTFHNQKTPGEMIERLDSDVMDLAIFFSQFLVQIVGNLLLVAGVLIVLYATDWRIGLVLTLYEIGGLLAFNRVREVATPYWKATREASTAQFGFIEEQISGIEDIRANGAEAYSLRNLAKFDRERLKTEKRAGAMSSIVIAVWIWLYGVGRFLAFGGSLVLFSQGAITLGTAYLITYYTDAIFRPLREIAQQIQNLQKAGGSIARVDELYRIESRLIEPAIPQPLPDGSLSVALESVTFGYAAEKPPIFADLSFSIAPGKVLGLLGRTGSGKTTIARLLFRLYDVQEGAVRIGGRNVTDVALADIQARIGLVTQDVQLFRASVRDNLTFFDKSVPDDLIANTLIDLGLGEWYARLPDGLATELEGGGKGISAGEAQLLAFTRVFLKNPGLVIMDEASSRLDPATEQLIERAIDKLLIGRTAIIIAHRLTTVQRADDILILENGEIAEYGAYADLIRTPDSRFAQLLRTGGLAEVLA